MSQNLITRVQENLQYPPLKKIDPNTAIEVDEPNVHSEHSFGQAAIPAILAAFSQYVQSDDGASDFLHAPASDFWIQKIFGKRQDEIVGTIGTLTRHNNNENIYMEMEDIANEVVAVTREQLNDKADLKGLKDYFKNEKLNFLSYLLPGLRVGEALDNDSLDDQTNKMEGPVSNLIQSIGKAFDKPEVAEKNV